MIDMFSFFFVAVGFFYSFQFDRDRNLKIFFKRREFLVLSLSLLCLLVEIFIHFFKNNQLLLNDMIFTFLFLSPFLGYLAYKVFVFCKNMISSAPKG
jgi:hypothetical protein